MEIIPMTGNLEDSSSRIQIHNEMRLKETHELVDIWKSRNREVWSDTVLDVVKEILLERLIELPSQELEAEKEMSEDDRYHNDAKLLNISSWSNTVSWIALAGFILAFLGRLVEAYQMDNVIDRGFTFFLPTLAFNYWINSLLLLVTGITFFLVLQAVSQGILMLMDLEENGSTQRNRLIGEGSPTKRSTKQI
jgi:hypothetical protein